MLVKIEARILIFPGTYFHFPSTSVPPGTFFRLWLLVTAQTNDCGSQENSFSCDCELQASLCMMLALAVT